MCIYRDNHHQSCSMRFYQRTKKIFNNNDEVISNKKKDKMKFYFFSLCYSFKSQFLALSLFSSIKKIISGSRSKDFFLSKKNKKKLEQEDLYKFNNI